MVDGGMAAADREAKKDAVTTSYKFELTFQNALCEDEVDEKMLHAMRRGVIPVFLGAPNVQKLGFPPKSFIWVGEQRYASPGLT
jgi:hypothetical protein